MRITLLLFCFLASAFPARMNAEPEPPSSKKKQPAYFRIRVFLLDEKQAVSATLPQPNADPVELLSAPSGEHPITTPYEGLPAKETKLAIRIGSQTHEVDMKLDEGIYYTLLVYREGGGLLTPLLQDTFPDPAEPGCHIRIFNFGSNRTANLSLDGKNEQQFAPNTFTELPALPVEGKLAINITIPDPGGGYPAIARADINIKAARALSVVIVPDYRGNLRPRIFKDGPAP
jgi:hypothetical protein